MDRINHPNVIDFGKEICAVIERYYPHQITIVELYGVFEALKGFINSQKE